MSTFIPRLEWNDITITGNSTLGSPTITSVLSTVNVVVGMIINHANFPANAKVLSLTSNTVTLDQSATVTGATVSFPLFQRFDFCYPSTKQAEPEFAPTEQVSESVGGKRQVQINNIIKKISLTFKFVASTDYKNYRDNFYLTWALYGKSFRYFESKEINTYENYELDKLDFKPERDIPKAGDFLYRIDLPMRRVYL